MRDGSDTDVEDKLYCPVEQLLNLISKKGVVLNIGGHIFLIRNIYMRFKPR